MNTKIECNPNTTNSRVEGSEVLTNASIKAELIAEAMATDDADTKEAIMLEANSIPDYEYVKEEIAQEEETVSLVDYIYDNSGIPDSNDKKFLFDKLNDFTESKIPLLSFKPDSPSKNIIDNMNPTIFDTIDLIHKIDAPNGEKNEFYFKPSKVRGIKYSKNKTILGLKLHYQRFHELKNIIDAEEAKPIIPDLTTKELYEKCKQTALKYGQKVKSFEEFKKKSEENFEEDESEDYYSLNFRKLAYVKEKDSIIIFLYIEKDRVPNIMENYTCGNGFEILYNDWININNIEGKISNTINFPLEIIYQLNRSNPQPDIVIVKVSSESIEFKVSPDRPILNANIQDLTILTPEAWKAIVDANSIDPLCFSYGGKAVRLVNDNERCTIDYLDVDTLRDISAKSTDWKKGDNDYNKPSFPPALVLKNMLVTECPLPKLIQVTETPYFSKSGELIIQEKFNSSTGIYFHNSSDLRINSIPLYPSANELSEAKEFLKKPFSDFPFSSSADFTNTIAFVLTPFIRFLISGHVPIFGITAPDVGTGKTFLFKIVASIYSNNNVITTAPRDHSEWHRKLFSMLLGGYHFIDFDNVNTLDSEALSAVLTSHSFSDRLLGKSTIISVPNNSIFAFTGNNPVISKELTRRTVFICLDAKSETPWNRNNFQIKNLNAWIYNNREKLITSILTLIQSWISAGKPSSKNVNPIGSFEEWTQVTAGILENAGYKNFLENSMTISNAVDIESNAWRLLIDSWHSTYGTKLIKTSHIFNIAIEIEGLAISGANPNAQKKSLGIMLKKQSGRVYGDWQILEAGTHQGAIVWKLDKTK